MEYIISSTCAIRRIAILIRAAKEGCVLVVSWKKLSSGVHTRTTTNSVEGS